MYNNPFKLLFPFNMVPLNNDDRILISYGQIDMQYDIIMNTTQSSLIPFKQDDDVGDRTLDIQEWVPFITNCRDYGNYVLLYDLLQNQQNCELQNFADTLQVSEIPNINQKASDYCDYSIECSLPEQYFDSPYKKWYQKKKPPNIFYITSRPQFSSFKNFSTTNLLQMISSNSQMLVPVQITTPSNYTESTELCPKKVILNIKYFQPTQDVQYIVKASMELTEYQQINADKKCNYEFQIIFQSLNYIEVIKYFQFSLLFYFFLFIIFTILIYFILYICYIITRTISQIRFPPILKIFKTYKMIFKPMIIGITLSGFLFFISILLVIIIDKYQVFGIFFYQIDIVPEIPDDRLKSNKGRKAMFILLLGINFIYYGSSLLIYNPDKEKEEQIKQTIQNNLNIKLSQEQQDSYQDQSNSQNNISLNSKSVTHKNLSTKSDEDEEEESYSDILYYKKISYFILNLVIGMIFIFIIQLSFTEQFKQSQWIFLVLFMIFETIFTVIIQKILKEQLLLAPILVAIEVIQYITVMAAPDLFVFIQNYLIRLLVQYSNRICFNPFLWRFIAKLNTIIIQNSHKYPTLFRFLSRFMDLEQKNDNLEYYQKDQYNDEDEKQDQIEEKTYEPIISTSLNFTSKAFAIFVRPLIVIVIYIFNEQTKIFINYEFRDSDMDKYILFAFVMLTQTVNEVFILGMIETLHDWKLFDYFSYCEYRYKNKEIEWLPSIIQLDRSIDLSYRSLDNLLFSPQYYLGVSVASFGIIMISISFIIIIQISYIFYIDPACFFIIIFFLLLGFIIKLLILYITNNYIHIWKPEKKKQKSALSSIQKFINNSGDLNFEAMIEAEIIKQHFISFNKEWLIKSMNSFINFEHFQENSRYLLNLYQKLKQEEYEDMRNQKRNQIHNQKNQIQLQNQMIKKQSELKQKEQNNNYNNDGNIVTIKKSHAKVMYQILGLWLNKAKETLYYQKLIQHIRIQNTLTQCQKCNIDVELTLVEKIQLNDLLQKFRFIIVGRLFDKDEWIKFYQKYQSFSTFCSECLTFLKNQKQPIKLQWRSKIYLLDWLMKARAQNLTKQIQKQKQLQIQEDQKEIIQQKS